MPALLRDAGMAPKILPRRRGIRRGLRGSLSCMDAIARIKLTPQEQTLYDSIAWDDESIWRAEVVDPMRQAAGALMESLVDRKAIPPVRWRWYLDSRGLAEYQVYRQRTFWAHLWYFIHGPKLPQPTIDGFRKIIREDRGHTIHVNDQLKEFVLEQMQNHGEADTDVEFEKLALECGRPPLAAIVRKAAKDAWNAMKKK